MTRFIFIVIILSSLNLQAQKIKVGFRGGASFANLINHNASGPNSLNDPMPINLYPSGIILNSPTIVFPNPYYETSFFKDMRIGIFSGFFVDMEMKKNWNLEIGLTYSQKGVNLKYSYATTIKEPNNTITQISYQVGRVLHTNYITVPVVVKFKFGKKHRLFLLGGIYEAIALNFKIIEASVKHTITTYSFVGQPLAGGYVENILSTGYLNRFDFGGMGGLGFDLPFNRNWSIGMDVRMAIGLINIPAKKSDYGFLSFGANSKNINFESGVRISYSIK